MTQDKTLALVEAVTGLPFQIYKGWYGSLGYGEYIGYNCIVTHDKQIHDDHCTQERGLWKPDVNPWQFRQLVRWIAGRISFSSNPKDYAEFVGAIANNDTDALMGLAQSLLED